jgi:serine/threonine-protein kinase
VPVDPSAATLYAPPAPVSEARRLIAGRYEILGLLGSGAMGNVYKARDLELDELCALKVLRPEVAGAPGALDRFRREVKLARRVTHPNVARVFDIGEGEGEKILTMELVDGEPLSALLAREGPLPVAQVVAIASSICAGLAAAHAAGVIHRDLKPDNVLVERGGRVVITDFGIARAAAAGEALSSAAFVGTPAYMAPEQIEGAAIDARADLYALGAMLFELCTGQLPWRGETVFAVAAARLLQAPPDPRALRPDLPSGLAALILRAMARRPDDRHPSAEAVSGMLATLTLPMTAPAAPPPRPAPELGPLPARGGAKRVAVLPFRNAGPPDHDYLADGLTEDVIDALSMAPGLRVASRGMVMRYKGSDRDPREVGRELDVQVVVDGTVRRFGDPASPGGGGVRISARLASVADGVQLWARRFDRPDSELLGASDDAARAIAEALAVEMGAPSRPIEADPEATDLYLRARAAYHRFFSDLGGEASIPLFERALARAPDDPRLLAGVAMARARASSLDRAVFRAAEEAAARAVALAPSSSPAHLAVAVVKFRGGDEVSAVRSARQALRLAPSNAEAHDLLGRMLGETSLLRDAVRHLSTALVLEPEITLSRLTLARTHELLGDHDEADRVAGERPAATLPFRARVLAWRRDARGAAAMLASVEATTPGFPAARALLQLATGSAPSYDLWAHIGDPGRVSMRGQAFFLQLEVEGAAYVGDRARALDALRRAAATTVFDVAWMDRCPLLADLRGEPAFAAARALVAERAARVEEAYLAPLG